MLSDCFKKIKIFKAIIAYVVVDVMNYFLFFKIAIQAKFSDQARTQNVIVSFVYFGVTRLMNMIISFMIFFDRFPVWAGMPFCVSSVTLARTIQSAATIKFFTFNLEGFTASKAFHCIIKAFKSGNTWFFFQYNSFIHSLSIAQRRQMAGQNINQ